MASAGRKQSSGGSFLFVNKNPDNLNSKDQAGAINAHVHADARAKKLATSQLNASSASLKNSKPSRVRPRRLTKVRQSRILLTSPINLARNRKRMRPRPVLRILFHLNQAVS